MCLSLSFSVCLSICFTLCLRLSLSVCVCVSVCLSVSSLFWSSFHRFQFFRFLLFVYFFLFSLSGSSFYLSCIFHFLPSLAPFVFFFLCLFACSFLSLYVLPALSPSPFCCCLSCPSFFLHCAIPFPPFFPFLPFWVLSNVLPGLFFSSSVFLTPHTLTSAPPNCCFPFSVCIMLSFFRFVSLLSESSFLCPFFLSFDLHSLRYVLVFILFYFLLFFSHCVFAVVVILSFGTSVSLSVFLSFWMFVSVSVFLDV